MDAFGELVYSKIRVKLMNDLKKQHARLSNSEIEDLVQFKVDNVVDKILEITDKT